MLLLSLVPRQDIAGLWPTIEPILRPAIETGIKPPEQVLADLAAGTTQCWSVYGGAAQGLIVTRVDETTDTHAVALWIVYAAGTISGSVKERLSVMRAVLHDFEERARVRGCAEMRVTPDRSWASVLHDYERDGKDYRKVL